jgi:hypothetical protein
MECPPYLGGGIYLAALAGCWAGMGGKPYGSLGVRLYIDARYQIETAWDLSSHIRSFSAWRHVPHC